MDTSRSSPNNFIIKSFSLRIAVHPAILSYRKENVYSSETSNTNIRRRKCQMLLIVCHCRTTRAKRFRFHTMRSYPSSTQHNMLQCVLSMPSLLVCYVHTISSILPLVVRFSLFVLQQHSRRFIAIVARSCSTRPSPSQLPAKCGPSQFFVYVMVYSTISYSHTHNDNSHVYAFYH